MGIVRYGQIHAGRRVADEQSFSALGSARVSPHGQVIFMSLWTISWNLPRRPVSIAVTDLSLAQRCVGVADRERAPGA